MIAEGKEIDTVIVVKDTHESKIGRFVRNVSSGPFAFALAVLAMIQGTRFIGASDTVPIVQVGWVITWVWTILYFLGGAGIIIGTGLNKARLTAAACFLYSCGAGVAAVAGYAFPFNECFYWQATQNLLLSLAAFFRARHLLRGQFLVWV